MSRDIIDNIPAPTNNIPVTYGALQVLYCIVLYCITLLMTFADSIGLCMLLCCLLVTVRRTSAVLVIVSGCLSVTRVLCDKKKEQTKEGARRHSLPTSVGVRKLE